MMNQKKKLNWRSILNEVKGKDGYEKTCILGKHILQQLGATSPETAKSGQVAYEKLCKHMGKTETPWDGLSKNTFIQYLSKAAANSGNDIFCGGRKQGYYVREEENTIDDGDKAKLTRKRRGKESLLYPVAKRWLVNHSFRAKIIARKKKNGKWGNPDVVGVYVHECFDQRALEIVTIECKNSLADWQQQIFEAVAHKRFADRAYFAFVLPVDEVEKQYGKLVEFAEYFGVGLLVLEMEQEVFERYNEKEPTIVQDLELLEFREIYPAPRNHFLIQARKDFLEGMGWKNWKDLDCLDTNKATEETVPGRGLAKQAKNDKTKRKEAGGTNGGTRA